MISIVNTECHVPKTFSDLAKIAAWGRLGLLAVTAIEPVNGRWPPRETIAERFSGFLRRLGF
ncbi:hypothetical protein [Sphingomonas fennica]|uniref:hypothetical protein n=1 Tax=Edaphosphingomonas fennica TaxID=114404 RepID=UPI001475FAFC|nr:hypothetical protein [Sphingomonas fennica]